MKTSSLLAPATLVTLVLAALAAELSSGRTPGSDDSQLTPQAVQLLPAGAAAPHEPGDSSQQEEAQVGPAFPKRPFTSPEAMQAEFLSRFQRSPGFGISRVYRPVFTAPAPALVWNGNTYHVEPPGLIGLEDEPIAYAPTELSHRVLAANTNLTSRQVRKLSTHRALTAFESNAVLALRAGRDLVVLTNRVTRPEAEFPPLVNGPELFVVGALRAGRDCAACHGCKQGTLLGAFAYSLSPEISSPVPGPVSHRNPGDPRWASFQSSVGVPTAPRRKEQDL